MTFASPLWLLFLVPVAILAIAYVVVQLRRERYVVRFATLPMLARLAPKRPKWRRHLPAVLVLLALGTLGVAGARPQVDRKQPYDRATVVVAIDTSGSMQATDVAPNRLDAARAAAKRFIEKLPATIDVGVVSFAKTATVLATPTRDHAAVVASLDQLEIGQATAIGEGVVTSLQQLKTLADKTPAGQRVPARVVLLSDGANTAGISVEDAAQQAEGAHIPVSTIAYGTPEGQLNGRAVPVDSATLAQLASETGGKAYTAADRSQLDSVYDDIGSIVGYRTVAQEVTAYFAVAGLLIALVAGALSLAWFSRLV